jgi:hypothetical protein
VVYRNEGEMLTHRWSEEVVGAGTLAGGSTHPEEEDHLGRPAGVAVLLIEPSSGLL